MPVLQLGDDGVGAVREPCLLTERLEQGPHSLVGEQVLAPVAVVGAARHRPNVERAVARVATWQSRRLKLRYRGAARNHAWLKRRTAALNLRNLISKGLTRHDGAWVLA